MTFEGKQMTFENFDVNKRTTNCILPILTLHEHELLQYEYKMGCFVVVIVIVSEVIAKKKWKKTNE